MSPASIFITGNYLTGGDNYRECGRRLDINTGGAFDPPLLLLTVTDLGLEGWQTAEQLIGKADQDLWISYLVRQDASGAHCEFRLMGYANIVNDPAG